MQGATSSDDNLLCPTSSSSDEIRLRLWFMMREKECREYSIYSPQNRYTDTEANNFKEINFYWSWA